MNERSLERRDVDLLLVVHTTHTRFHTIALRIAMHGIEFPSSATHNGDTLFMAFAKDNITWHMYRAHIQMHRLWPHNDFSCAMRVFKERNRKIKNNYHNLCCVFLLETSLSFHLLLLFSIELHAFCLSFPFLLMTS